MEHYYVVNGNEYGADIYTKKNFIDMNDAKKHYEDVKYDDFGCMLVHVNSIGKEEIIETFINEE